MSDAIVYKENVNIKHLGKTIKTPIYIQFVPGIVQEVVTSTKSQRTSPNTVNSILAYPHIKSDKEFRGPGTEEVPGESNRYLPLLRGMTDTPTKGDPVLLTKMNGLQYYIGPINTVNNSPNWNNDMTFSKVTDFNFKKTNHKRLQKFLKPELDGELTDYNDIHGDQIFEGRHGNSIRIGSRDINPYIFISNERGANNTEESIIDGSLISITSNGTLQQHFGGYEDIVQEVSVPGFTLASDRVEENNRTIGSMIQSVNLIDDSYPYLYEFGNLESEVSLVGGTNQMLFNSDRIIINSKKNDVFVSSFNDIHLGAGRNLSISTKESLIIDSQNIYLGKVNVNNSEREMEPMVLGNQLFDILTELTDALSKTMSTSVYAGGTTFPLMDSKKSPMSTVFIGIKQKLEKIKSNYHYIEPNEGTNK
tara:strand:- start:37 stop:1296 length:1260 start_codon:yes stop_codon:yes gene_type:complete